MLQKIVRKLFDEGDTGQTRTTSLPAIDQIQENDDVSCFMCDDVDEATRKQALRTLFHKPKFNRRDGLDDYDDDYRQLAMGSTRFENDPHS